MNDAADQVNYITWMGELVRIIQHNGIILTGKLTLSEQPDPYVALLSGGGIKKIDLNDIKLIERI